MNQHPHGDSPTEGTDGAAGIRPAAATAAVPRRLAVLFLVSVLGLFLEVCLIRWHGTEFRAAAYFRNVTLLACFLGLGLGFALAQSARSYAAWTLPLLAAHVVLLDLLSRLGVDSLVRLPHGSSQLWAWGVHAAETTNLTTALAQGAAFYGFFLFLFLITIVVFIPIGQLTGVLMNGLPPLRAYTVNILGSLGGVLLFTAVSYLWLPPAVWFGLAAIMGLALLRHSAANVASSAVACVVMIAWTGSSGGFVKGGGSPHMQDIYSPYQLLELQPYHVVDADGRRLHRGMAAFANKTYHLKAEDLSRAWLVAHGARFPWAAENALAYELPYRFVEAAQRVLVIGSGAGNDVAAGLRVGGPDMRVDAVEIDPAIIAIGRRHHPEAPYDDRRVRVHIGDARQFIKRSTETYDLVVFGLVDSHTLLSGMSSLRLDNFVYTLECFAEARRILAPGGAMAVSFSTPAMNHIGRRMYDMLRRTFPESPPRAFRIGFDSGVLYVAGEGVGAVRELPAAAASSEVTEAYRAMPANEVPPPATDDWPFLYMADRRVPTSHLGLAATLAMVAVVWVRRVTRGSGAIDWHFFFLGSAFLLIEVKGIAELALVWGTTWVVNTVVIGGILGFILLANWFVAAVRPAGTRPYYAGLAISLLAGFALPVSTWLQFGWAAAAVTSAALLLVPLFFAGVIFAVSLKGCASVRAAFASNLIGAILGGFVEYSSMALGFRALYLLALGLYAASFLVLRGSRAR
ncbi:MAG: methyltransferase domain-containing protein [Planctomycetes bacterium]|nr:methyltransferase domain-containing protein [Planctomycetota bacterium]